MVKFHGNTMVKFHGNTMVKFHGKTMVLPWYIFIRDTYEVVFGESDIWQRNWGHELYPTFTVCIHTMSPETLQ